MLHGAVGIVHVQARRQLGVRDTGMAGQQVADGRHRAVKRAHLGVDLHAVARAEDHRADDVIGPGDVVHELGQIVTGQHGPLKRRQRRALVAQTDDQHTHVPTACAPVL